MKKNDTPIFLPMYNIWANNEYMDYSGLCSAFKQYHSIFELIKPDKRDKARLEKDGHCTIWWGSESPNTEMTKFTPLRQNLVLLMAALNNEL